MVATPGRGWKLLWTEKSTKRGRGWVPEPKSRAAFTLCLPGMHTVLPQERGYADLFLHPGISIYLGKNECLKTVGI